jgi:hypothetical protein
MESASTFGRPFWWSSIVITGRPVLTRGTGDRGVPAPTSTTRSSGRVPACPTRRGPSGRRAGGTPAGGYARTDDHEHCLGVIVQRRGNDRQRVRPVSVVPFLSGPDVARERRDGASGVRVGSSPVRHSSASRSAGALAGVSSNGLSVSRDGRSPMVSNAARAGLSGVVGLCCGEGSCRTSSTATHWPWLAGPVQSA